MTRNPHERTISIRARLIPDGGEHLAASGDTTADADNALIETTVDVERSREDTDSTKAIIETRNVDVYYMVVSLN